MGWACSTHGGDEKYIHGGISQAIIFKMNPIHNILPFSERSILILFPHLYLCLSSGLFPSGFQPKSTYLIDQAEECQTKVATHNSAVHMFKARVHYIV
jgi:hypothetical protein